MSNGIEPIPISVPEGPSDGDPELSLLAREAFRQGWLAARHWPNHPLPGHLFVTLECGACPTEAVLRIRWP